MDGVDTDRAERAMGRSVPGPDAPQRRSVQGRQLSAWPQSAAITMHSPHRASAASSLGSRTTSRTLKSYPASHEISHDVAAGRFQRGPRIAARRPPAITAVIDLTEIPVIDNHVHPWAASTREISVEELAGSVAFSDAVVRSVRREFLPFEQLAPALRLFRETNLGASFLRGELARFLDVEDDWATVVAARNRMAAADYRAWTARLFGDARIETLLVDEGGSGITLEELGAIVPVRLRRVARADNFIRDLLVEEDSWATLFRRYQEALAAAIAGGAIAFKSVIAYRTGLDIQPVCETEPSPNFQPPHSAP